MLLVQRNQGAVGVEGHGGIDGVGTPQAVLGSEILSLLCQPLVEGLESHVGEVSHGRGELLGSRRIAAGPADGSGDFYTEQIGDDNGQGLRLRDFEESPAGLMTRLTLIERIDPYAGVNGVHPLTPHRQHRGRQGL